MMSEQNIPTEMLDAATKAVWACSAQLGLDTTGSGLIAINALRAAGVPALLARIAELEAAALAYLKAEEIYHAAHIKGEAGISICQKAAETEDALANVLGYKLKVHSRAGGE